MVKKFTVSRLVIAILDLIVTMREIGFQVSGLLVFIVMLALYWESYTE